MGREGAEETVSEYANRLADNIVMSEQSEMERYIRQLMDQGAGEEEAKKAAAQEFWVKQPALAGLGGALSGGVMGGGAQVLNRMNSFLQGPQGASLPKALEQGTMEQNEQEAARRRFLRKEVAGGGEQGQEAADAGTGRGVYAPDYDQGTAELETDNAGRNRKGEGPVSATQEGTGGIPAQARVGQQLGGRRDEQIGEYLYRYEETPHQNIVPEVRQMMEECGRRGAKVIVFDGEAESEHNGTRSKSSAAAFTRADGAIMISSAAADSELRNQIVRHELLHSIKKTNSQRYQQLEQKVRSLDISLEDETGVLNTIIDTYGHNDLFSQNSRLLEEVLAQLAGWHSEDPAFAREKFGPLFVDYDGVIAELEGLDAEMLAQNQRDSFLQGPQGASLPKALEQGTMDQNEQEAARRRFLRKEVADEAERGYDAGRERSLAQGGGEESGLRGLPPGRGRLSSDYHSNQRTAELETDNARGNRGIEGPTFTLEERNRRAEAPAGLRRQSGGFREEKIGDYIYRYQEARQEEIAPRIRQAQEEFRQRGVKSIVVDGEVTAEQKGRISTSQAAAFVRADGSVVISKDAVNSGLIEQIVPHESLHSVKKTNPQRYRQLEDRIYDLDLNVVDQSEILDAIRETYGYDDFGRENSRLLEEVLTQLAGWHSEDPAFAREKFGPLFVDYDGVIAELEGLDAEMLAQNQRDSFLQGPQGASLPKALEQGTMDQNEQEAARRRFLRKEVADGGEQGQEDSAPRVPLYQPGGMGKLQHARGRQESQSLDGRNDSQAPGKTQKQRGGYREEQIEQFTYRYEETPQEQIVREVQDVVDEFARRGVQAIVFDGVPSEVRNGEAIENHAIASTRAGGSVMVSSKANQSEILKQIVDHEMIHSVKKTNPVLYQELVQKIKEIGIDFQNGYRTAQAISDAYDYDDLFDEDSKLLEEALAQFSGWLQDDPEVAFENFNSFFVDYDAAEAAIADFHAKTIELARGQAALNNVDDSDQNSSPPPSAGGSLALTRKGSEYLSRAERQAADSIAKAMNIPKWAKREKLGPAVRQLAEQLTQDGRISAEAADSAFEAAYEQGLIVLDDFAGQYADLKRELRRTRFQLSEQDKADLGDYGDFRRRNMGRLNIVNQGGIPVDVKYQELAATYPELFDPQISHPADQLLAIEEIRNQMDETELSLDQYYGPEAEQYKEFARYEFDRAMEKLGDEAAYVRRYEEDQARKNRKTEAPEADIQTIKEAYARNRQLTRASEKAAGKYLLTEGDRRQIDRLLKEEIRPEELPQGANRQGILEVYQARKAQRDNMEPVRQYRRQVKELYRQRALELAEGADGWKDKKIGLAYSRETAERNMTDIMGKEQARAMIDEYFWPIHREEAEKTRLKNQLRDRIRDLKLSQKAQYQITYQDPTNGAPVSGKVSESALVQLLGENVVGLEAVRASGADAAKIQRAADTFRQTYDELFGMAEEALIRNGYPPPGYIEGYFPHFQKNKPDGFFARIRNAAGFGLEEGGLPTEIAGQTHTFKPGKKWFGNFLERTGTGTEYDALKGFDRYLEGITDVIYHTDNIQRLRGLESALRYKFSDEGARAEIDQTRGDRQLDEQTREAMLEQLYSRNKSQLPGLVTWLRNYTDILAGKKHPSDRQAEHELGRRIYEISKKLEGRVAANMVGGNIASASTNFIPLTQAWGRLKTRSLLGGIYDTIRYHSGGDGFVDGSTFLTNRRGSEPLSLSKLDKAGAKASILMELIDNFTSEAITRARYAENLEDGLDLSAAMKDADEWTAGLMADRSKGSMPTMFEQKNPLIKTLNMFQLEVNNQLSYLFKDMPREAKEKGGLALALWMTKMFLGAWLYNEAAERITGRRPALDPADMIWQAYQDFADPDTKASEALGNLGKSATEQLPFIGGLMGGGRLPISSALPDLTQLAKLADRDAAPEKKKEIAKKELLYKPGAYLAMPFGGGQLKKSAEAFQTLARGGSYARNNKGEEQLRFLANGKKPSAWIKGLAFGQYSLPEAQDYVAGGFKTLSAKQTKTVEEARKRGMDPQAVVDLIGRLKQAQAEKNDAGETVRTENQVKRRMIRETEFSAEEKSWLDTQLLSDGFFMKKEIAADYSSEAALKLSEYGTGVQDKAREAEKAGVSPEIFLAAYEAQKGMESDKGKDGQPIPLSKMKKRKAAIDQAAPGLSPTQRNQVYEILGISAKAR